MRDGEAENDSSYNSLGLMLPLSLFGEDIGYLCACVACVRACVCVCVCACVRVCICA